MNNTCILLLITGVYCFFLQDRIAAFQMFAVMYIKYIQIFRKIEECYDQVISYKIINYFVIRLMTVTKTSLFFIDFICLPLCHLQFMTN